MKKYRLSFLFFLILPFTACTTLKPYERIYVTDPEMQTGRDNGVQFINYVHSIREGTTPPGSAKGNGGCGCN